MSESEDEPAKNPKDVLKELIKRRGSYKGRLTIFINYLNELSAETLTATGAKELQLRLNKQESLYDSYDSIQLQLECLTEDVEAQYSARNEFESQYYKALACAQDLLCKFNKNCDDSSESDGKSTRASTRPQLVRLPTIQLPKFSGRYENWLEFRDTFTSLIHSNESIDEINKFHYLRASLEGSAAVVIQSMEFSASNYNVAWKLLRERFDNKRLLVQNHVSALFNIENITKECSITLKLLIDQLNKNIRALQSLGEPVHHWDTLLIYIITQKLDAKTFREWEEHKGSTQKDDSITFDSFITFIRQRADLIETLELSRNQSNKSNNKIKTMVSIQGNPNTTSNTTGSQSSCKVCPKCKNDHNLSQCPQFLALTNEARLKLLPSYKVCFNCFRSGHFANHCKKPSCKICKRRHNTLIHLSEPRTNNNVQNQNVTSIETEPSLPPPPPLNTLSANVTSSGDTKQHDVILSTALIKVYNDDNREYIVRAVLDSGSTSCLITEKLCQQLNLKTREINRTILGINNVTSRIGKLGHVNIKSLRENYATDINCFVLPSITDRVPGREIDITHLRLPSNICLADPTFYKPADIDILLGADLFWDLLGSEKIKLGDKLPILYDTKLGWIISGPISSGHFTLLSNDIRCNLTTLSDTDGSIGDSGINLTRFWQLEEVNSLSNHYSPAEKLCEEHFVKNVSRLEDGRFCVRIPLKQNPAVLGNSLEKATQCLFSLERRLKVNPELSKMYYAFMSEYQSLGHMSERQLNLNHHAYYIPHHGVLRENSTTTKLRVVYNASCPTSSGVSYNDIQMIGPTVQDDLLAILLRFRQHKYILSADVEKMYRQVVVHPSDRHLQQIVWRNNTSEPVKIFELHTVTYGTTSAPFLATRCLKQIGLDCSKEKIAEIIQHDFYVDDLLTGGDDLNHVINIRKEVTNELASAGMPLRKWKSNEPKLVPETFHTPLDLNFGSQEPSKLLGLGWHADSDELCFPIGDFISNGNTKRAILSVIAQIFDPLGLLSPIVITMKMLLQTLWLQKISWDEPLSPDIHKLWCDIIKNLSLLNDIRIPRRVICEHHKALQLHIFSDASERAYGACAYVRSVSNDGEVSVSVLMGKSRVAPIKPTTIPRLELCGVLVATRLYEKIVSSLRVQFNEVYLWTDSTIVLGWLQMLPSKLQPFVRNRVAEILDKAGSCTWHHVPTNQNPADLISRGMDISVLQNSDLWWSGPNFLRQEPIQTPSQPKHTERLPETKPDLSLHAVVNDTTINNEFITFNRFSNYSRLVRSVAYVLRFVKRCKKQPLTSDFLSQDELQEALNLIITKCQDESFSEYKVLLRKETLPKKSPLVKFNVYLDENKIMRVGGRLDNSEFNYNKKHPIIIQSTHVFTKLLFESEHKKMMHAGPQLLLASIREFYWPIGGRNLAKSCYHKCVRCTRMKGKIVNPVMGNLPRQRLLSGGAVFENVGVDYAGPILSASRQGRGCRLVKVYIAIFICFSTKAIHLELVSDLTSNHYLMALRRFIARRGKPLNIYSDNGTSFVGAYNDLSKFLKANCNSLSESAANESIRFHFIPAYSPHFGGLWEAGVKSTKYHLRRVLGNCALTYEELNTTLTQIEAILNSRPLTPLSSDPADCTPLTPGHFIIGRPMTCLPQPDHLDRSTTSLSRFQRIEQLRQHFWSRWSKEYVAELQQRVKWRSCKDGLELNSLVVVKEDNLPPLKWRLGRIVAVHPGPDGIVRVADIRTSTGVIRRAFSKICPLPVPSASV
ncbi:uncharacterized protein LOC126379357 [Pectinophora gossypiella]|uniref:uncharacterized protein LOC126379357 n=1 Tax=Pectinophora gossypiella TaxID=13191 RepID=UPI00214E1EAC|nr:uncharacterized protein LOC126379357 [Pectinophora gossypiella]